MAGTVCKRDRLSGRVIRKELAAKSVADAVGDITPGCEIYGLTKGTWSLIDLIEHVLRFTGPAEVTLSTWTAANADIGFATKLLTNGAITKLRFVVDFSFPTRQPAYCAALREAFGDDSIRITKNHAKFVLLRNKDWNVVLRTSMNLNENRRLESFEISDDFRIADWLQEVVDELFSEQSSAETFSRRPIEHMEAFETQWGDDGSKEAAANSTDAKKFFGDGPFDVDLRRSGVGYD